ncbi:porin family protein [Bdellovibrio sp. NC01]|uniref:porin family protein n=1 Tax=Bdellovibrio sp. NC01 TaxID=2220073 RepID=UPI001157DBB1|nr:porin family protein [Bdellovibrio sp. NC01]QDK39357.1 hypothetical protein DOE51_18020 [Bdellovibrio sp. NC01]
MCLYKFILFFVINVFVMTAHAQEQVVHRRPAQALMANHFRVEVSYISWKEFADVEPAATQPKTYSDFIGNALTGEYEHYFLPRWGAVAEGSLMFGQANLGAIPNYQAGNVRWWGIRASYRGVYRFSTQVASSAGVLVLNRQIDYPSQTGVTDVKSGAQVNYGLIADLTYQLTPSWLIRQEIGGLFVKASTLWSIGLGYRF